jgi:sugar lactone lactonase YvrE
VDRTLRRSRFLYALVLALSTSTPVAARALPRPGDVLLLYGIGSELTVRALDLNTFQQTTVTGATWGGPLAVDPQDRIVFADGLASAIQRFDPTDGSIATISAFGIGDGPTFLSANDLAFDSNGLLWVANGLRLFSVDPETGTRDLVFQSPPPGADAALSAKRLSGEPSGTMLVLHEYRDSPYTPRFQGVVRVDPIGPTLVDLVPRQDYGFGDLAVSPDGRIFLTYQGRVVRVDPVSGLHEMVSDPSRGAGPAFQFPATLIAPSNEGLVVGDYDLGALVRVDIATGDRSILSGAAVGQGPDLSNALVWGNETSGAIIATSSGGMLRIDPASGDRERLLEGTVGTGPLAIPALVQPGADSLALGPGGAAFVADGRSSPSPVLSVELATGDRSFLPDADPSDPVLTALGTAESTEATGNIIALATQSGVAERVVARIDPETGRRTVVSGGGVGNGPLWSGAIDVAVGAGAIFVLDGTGIFASTPRAAIAPSCRTRAMAQARLSRMQRPWRSADRGSSSLGAGTARHRASSGRSIRVRESAPASRAEALGQERSCPASAGSLSQRTVACWRCLPASSPTSRAQQRQSWCGSIRPAAIGFQWRTAHSPQSPWSRSPA